MDQGLVNLRWAFALVDGLAAAGVRRVVISPGSRSTPLVLACDRHPAIKTHVILDERSAAFFALGQSLADATPSAVIATSGSAPAHWYPAVLEASASKLPLILLSADRPAELQNWGANQTTDQQRLFGSHVRAFHQAGPAEDDDAALRQIRLLGIKAAQQSLWPKAGAVHINLPFREPLIPKTDQEQWPTKVGAAFPLAPSRMEADSGEIERLAEKLDAGRGFIVAGPLRRNAGFADAVTALADKLDCPILADPLSGLRFGAWDQSRIETNYDALLRRGTVVEADWMLRFGAAPVSKHLLAHMARSDAFQALVTSDGDWPDPTHRSAMRIASGPEAVCRALLSEVERKEPADRLFDGHIEIPNTDNLDRPLESHVIRQLIDALPDDTVLFSGNSQPIRQLDAWSGSGAQTLSILCNRGLSGIDGNLATLLGLTSASRSPVVGLIGDLTLLHDLNSLMNAKGLNLIIIVLNNGGGGIFGQLAQATLDSFETYWLTPQSLELAKAADLYGIGYRRVERQSDFPAAFIAAMKDSGVQLVEIPIDREYSLERHQPG